MPTDEELIHAVASGDGDALRELCRRHERAVYQLIHRHTGGRDADDIYQETWLRVVRAAGRFDPAHRFTSWLFRIALNLCRDWRRRPPLDPTERGEDLVARGPGTTAVTEAALDARRLLAALPEAQRSAVVLRYYYDLPEEEVAQVLGCPRGTVKSRLHHAMRRLLELARESR